ncbi:MAG: DNA polymerase Y family protein [Pseudomonadota bacterium]
MAGTPRQSQPDLFRDVSDPQANQAHQERQKLQSRPIRSVGHHPSTEPLANVTSAQSAVWICLYFPGLPLQALQDQCSATTPSVVVDGDRQRTVIAVNRAANASGLVAGQSLRTAMALCQELDVLERSLDKETALLAHVAQRLMSLSPQVCQQPPQSLLLEVRGSLKLFNGIENLLARLFSHCLSDHHVRYAVAPTPMGASWLVRGGLGPLPEDVVNRGRDAPEFQQLLNALDLGVTHWPDTTLNALREMGIYTIGDCRRLPRAGLARRFGVEVPQDLAKALGELPDIRDALVSPPQFDAVVQLDSELTATGALLPVCTSLLRQLELDLRRRQAAVRELTFCFHAWQGQAGQVALSLCAPSHCVADWLPVLQAQLETVELSQPVVAVSLCAAAHDALELASKALDLTNNEGFEVAIPDSGYALLDRLRARLGKDAVARLLHVAEHRPERASQSVGVFDADHPASKPLPPDWQICDVPLPEQSRTAASIWLQRPLWLLERPQPLAVRDGRPYHLGALLLNHGPERISAGWWEHNNSVRDYFVATDTDAARLWVFRSWTHQHEPRWWLHGVFG